MNNSLNKINLLFSNFFFSFIIIFLVETGILLKRILKKNLENLNTCFIFIVPGGIGIFALFKGAIFASSVSFSLTNNGILNLKNLLIILKAREKLFFIKVISKTETSFQVNYFPSILSEDSKFYF